MQVPDFFPESNNGENQQPMRHQAYLHIRKKIVSLELPPGSVIDESALQLELGMGRTPIREGLQRLALEKLVTILPRRGMFVTEIGITDLQRLFELRLDLEGLAAELAAQRGTDEQIEQMEAILAHLPTQGEQADVELLIAVDEASHKLIYEAADNKFLEDTLTTLYALSLRLWYLALAQIGSLQGTVLEHRDILAALKQRDSEQAGFLLRRHIRTFQDEIQAAMMGASNPSNYAKKE